MKSILNLIGVIPLSISMYLSLLVFYFNSIGSVSNFNNSTLLLILGSLATLLVLKIINFNE